MSFGSRVGMSFFALIALLPPCALALDVKKAMPVAFSHSHGFTNAPFQLSLKSATPNAIIRYTLDGSLPTAVNGKTYSAPLWIDSTAVVRAVALTEELAPSAASTATYIFPTEVPSQSPAGAPYGDLPSSWGNNASNYGMDRRITLPEPECIVLNGKYYFSAYTPQSGLEPWVSDGTPQGTHLIDDLNPGPRSSGPGGFTVFKNKVYFRANNGSVGAELWETDGTAGGTKCSGDLWPGFTRQGGENSPSIAYSSYPNHLAATKNMLFFSASNSVNGDEVYAFMGQVMPSIPVKDIASLSRGSYPNNLTPVKTGDYSIIYFTAATPSHGMELWVSNGTTDGTMEIKDIREGAKSSDPQRLTMLGSTLFFTANDSASGRELWKSDGTVNGASRVADLAPGADSSDPQNLCAVGETLVFSAATPQDGLGLYATRGDAVNTLRIRSFAPINGKSPALQSFTALDERRFFFTVNGEPWISDGTDKGTFRLSAGAKNARDFTLCGNRMFFSAESDAGRELWLSDGTSAGTKMMTDLAPGADSSNPLYLADAGNGKLFFAATEPSIQGVYITDGTTATRLCKAGIESPQTLQPGDLQAIPSFSLAVNTRDFFDAGGIYSNANRNGESAEKPASLEYFPTNSDGFQIDAGVRVRGGFSRSSNNPKHAVRFFFNDQYAGKLKYPFFGDSGAGEFSKIDLRTFNNYSWSIQGDPRCICIRDQFARDLQYNLDQFGSRGKFAYLYINGMFFGLYDLDERPGGDYGETYVGGNDNDYDVIKVSSRARPPLTNRSYAIYPTNGDMNAWTSLWKQLRDPSIKNLDAYMKVQGLNPDGTTNSKYPTLVDVDNLINYMMVIFWTADQDAPLTAWSGSIQPNNFFAIRDQKGASGGFKFFIHDAEHTLLSWAINENRVGPWISTINTNDANALALSNPQHMFDLLAQNPEFRFKIADYVNKQMLLPEGPLYPANVQKTFLNRKQEIDRAIVAESARWGGSRVRWPMSRNNEWINEITSLAYDDPTHAGLNDGWMLRRTDILFNQLKRAGYYPKIDAPALSKLSQTATLSNPNANALCYVTTNGDDPRLVGGTGGPRNDGSAPAASIFDKPIALSPGMTLKTRFRATDGTWSALAQMDIPAPYPVRVCEIMYDPQSSAGDEVISDSKNFEYIRLINLSDKTIDVSSLRISGGVNAVLPFNTFIEPGKTLAIANTPKSFEQRYKEKTPYAFKGALSNDQDDITLVDPAGKVVQHFTYSGKWHPQARGKGASIVPVDPKADDATLSKSSGWKIKQP